VPSLLELADVLWVLETKSSEAGLAVVDAVAVEVDDVIRPAGATGAVELFAQCGQRGRIEHLDADKAAQRLHRLDQRQCTGAMIDVEAGLVLGPRGNEEDANRCGDDRHVEHAGAWQASADANGLRALKKEGLAVVQKFPRQAEQECRRLAGGLHVGSRRAGFERCVDLDRETATGIGDPRPGLHDVRRVGYGQRRIVQELSPFHEVLLDLARAIAEILARPDGVLFQIPTQFLGLDRPDRGDESPALRAMHVFLSRRSRLIDEPGASRCAAHAVLLIELQVGELEHELFQRLCLRLRFGGNVRGEPFAQCDEDRVQCRVDPARVAAQGNVNRLLAEERLELAELRPVQRKRDDRKPVPAALFLHLERVAQLLGDRR
jgi:hypothetical protein